MMIDSKITFSEKELQIQQEYEKQVALLLQERYDFLPLAYVHSFGCQQSVADGEKLKGMLAEMGYGFTDDTAQAQIILFNTCAVRENAEERVFGNIGELKHLKRQREDLIIGICGCMTQQQHIADKIRKSYPYVDLILGTHALPMLPQYLLEILNGKKRVSDLRESDGGIAEGLPVQREDGIKAWLPIMYGCNNFCTYCIVPYVRGRERSRTPDMILQEVSDLVQQGYKEITLLGQNVNSYGKGLEEKINFSGLLRKINAVPGDFRIRFMTSHPKDCTPELLDTIAECEKVCNHLHLPVQSGSNKILQQMNRKYTVEHYLELIDYARKKNPGISFTSDIIVGFPGERYEDFLMTMDLIKKVRFTNLYQFIYSRRSGTKAAEMEDPIPAEDKSLWFRELLAEQTAISAQVHQGMVGKRVRVLADGIGKRGEGWLAGRTDENLIVEWPGDKTQIGQFVTVEIARATNCALIGE